MQEQRASMLLPGNVEQGQRADLIQLISVSRNSCSQSLQSIPWHKSGRKHDKQVLEPKDRAVASCMEGGAHWRTLAPQLPQPSPPPNFLNPQATKQETPPPLRRQKKDRREVSLSFCWRVRITSCGTSKDPKIASSCAKAAAS